MPATSLGVMPPAKKLRRGFFLPRQGKVVGSRFSQVRSRHIDRHALLPGSVRALSERQSTDIISW